MSGGGAPDGSSSDGADAAGGETRRPSSSDGGDRAEADESGYPRDDYWRESGQDAPSPDPDEVPEPSQGYRFEDAEDKGGEAPDPGPGKESRERGNAGGRDDASIVER